MTLQLSSKDDRGGTASARAEREDDDVVRTLVRPESRTELPIEEVRRALDLEARRARPPDDDSSDAVVSLREFGTTKTFSLSPLSLRPVTADGVRSRSRADPPGIQVTCERGLWKIIDRHGIADLRHDGIPCREATLTAGAEVALGGLNLVAESPRSISLRQFCARLIGWSDARLCEVDRALRAIRACQLRRAPLLLRGQGDMVLVAEALHRHTAGSRAPFFVADPKRGNTPATVRNAPNLRDGLVAMRAAAGGSLCLREARLPPDFGALLHAFRAPESHVQLIVCMHDRRTDGWLSGAEVVELPSLDSRPAELERVILEYASEAQAVWQLPDGGLPRSDLDWIRCVSARSLPDIEKATRRALAVRCSHNMDAAADMLGMAAVSLSRWLARRVKDPDTGRPLRPPEFARGARSSAA